jgi:hypothetical protein
MKIDFKNYDNAPTEDFELPPVGIESIDRAVFDLFDKAISFEVDINGDLSKVPVVFASGERFALTRRNNPIRDKNNALILPIISIVRGDVDFSATQGTRGTAISFRDQPSYIVKKRLAKSDRKVQNILNKKGLKNQDNVAIEVAAGEDISPNKFASRRKNIFSKGGGLISLSSDLNKNIYEVIQVPYPTFITMEYNITFWCQYMSQMNAIHETYLAHFKGQAEEFLLINPDGYEYVAASSTSFTSENNFTNYTEEERIIKSSVKLTVPGYILNTKQPGLPNQLRSTFSAPFIEFGYYEINDQVIKSNRQKQLNDRDPNKYILSDVTLADDIKDIPERGDSSEKIKNIIVNPFTGDQKLQYSKILTRNDRAGETVASSLIVKKIETQFN